MEYIIGILIGLGALAVWQIFGFFIRKGYKMGVKSGTNQVVKYIFEQIQEKGQIDLILDGQKITVTTK